jgi:sugar phosphate isomerase/epimerase
MKTIKGPAIFLAQFAGDAPPFNSLPAIADWAAKLGFKGLQIPSWDRRLFDLEKAAESQAYCDEVKGILAQRGLQVTELSTHLQGQLVAVHPAYDTAFDGFAAPQVRGRPEARTSWAIEQCKLAAKASRRLGVTEHATFSGALAWPYLYPWPQRPPGLIETAFDELAKRWRPILDAFEESGVNVCYEIHPGEDLHDGATFEMFLERVGGHSAATSSSTRAISCCSSSTISNTSTSITSASACFTSRMRSSIRPGDRASMAATSPGPTAPAASAPSATGR